MVDVRTLLTMPELQLAVRVGATGPARLLDRPISRVYSTELPDPSRYLSGGEFVVSGLLWWHEDADAESFVAALARYDVAALAASAADTGGVLPESLVDACVRHRVALLEAAPELSFAVITERVVLALAAERGATVLGTHRRLLSAAAGEGGIAALLASGTRELGVPCQVRSATGRVVAGEPLPSRGEVSVDVPRHSARTLVGWSLVLAVTEREWQREWPPERRAVADEIAGMVGLERTRSDQARRTRDEAARPLLRALAGGTSSAAELTTHLAAAGITTGARLRVLIAATGTTPDELAAALLDEVLGEFGVTGPIATADDTAYAVAEAGDGWPADAVSRAGAVLDAAEPWRRDCHAVLAISGVTTADGLRGAVEEARRALALGRQRPGGARDSRGEVVAGDEIAAHHLLLANTPDELRRALRRRLLGTVEDYDAVHGGELLRSLRVYLECSGSWRAAASRMHVHVNTLRYRIGRVEQLLGRDLSEFADRVDLYLALEIREP